MRITRIDVDGNKDGHSASFMRRPGNNGVMVAIRTPQMPDGRLFLIDAGSGYEDMRAFARDVIQPRLDVEPDDNDVNQYLRCLQDIMD